MDLSYRSIERVGDAFLEDAISEILLENIPAETIHLARRANNKKVRNDQSNFH